MLARVLLINYANDPSGASDISVDITVNGGPLPSQVDVKYLLAANVTQKGNFTWAGQTLGGNFQADGRLYGNENITTVNCGVPSDGSSQTAVCRVSVPAPGAALVFLSGTAAQAEDAGAPSTTFSTSSFTKIHGTVWVSPSELASSNGRGGVNQQLGSTSAKSFRERGASITWRAPSVRIMLLCALAFVPWNW